MAKPKFDYEGDEFYEEIKNLAMQGQKDSEIAYSLASKFGVDLAPAVFLSMKNGNYDKWTPEQNAERGEKIANSLARGRLQINAIVRGRFLKTALGGIKVKGKSVVKRHMIINGEQTEDMIVETRETEQETPPNMQALATWLYHFDPDWRKIQQQKSDEEEKGIPFDPKKGVSINKWIEREIEENNEYSSTEDGKDA